MQRRSNAVGLSPRTARQQCIVGGGTDRCIDFLVDNGWKRPGGMVYQLFLATYHAVVLGRRNPGCGSRRSGACRVVLAGCSPFPPGGDLYGCDRSCEASLPPDVVPSEHWATVLSFDSMIESDGSAAGQIGLGCVSLAQSIQLGYIVGGLVSLGMLPALRIPRGLGESADVIDGTAGRKSSCAARDSQPLRRLIPVLQSHVRWCLDTSLSSAIVVGGL